MFADNLAPSELKKLLNKQRRAKKKAEQRCAEEAQALVRKEQYNKSKQQEVEQEAAQLDELVPEKLAKVCLILLKMLFVILQEVYSHVFIPVFR